uniref:DUF7748 domain-containing protein n=1 Tax=Physcomitrium patens TaxID=3218 RepID=A9RIH1_PHYPA|nr:hypothetical protein PHYPA_014983 [Physcomitrium patens]
MACSKVTTVIHNLTNHVLVLNAGTPRSSAKLATLEIGGEHKIKMDVNWTYQEFMLKGGEDVQKVVISSDECVDFERIDVSEIDGRLEVQRVPRKQFDDSAYSLSTRWHRTFIRWLKVMWV